MNKASLYVRVSNCPVHLWVGLCFGTARAAVSMIVTHSGDNVGRNSSFRAMGSTKTGVRVKVDVCKIFTLLA